MLLPNKRTAVRLLFGLSWPVAAGLLLGGKSEKPPSTSPAIP